MSEWAVEKSEAAPVLRIVLENEFHEISHLHKNWHFTEAEPDTIHAYLDAIVSVLKSANFSEETIVEGFREYLRDREE